jgi:hypothetical protein
LVARDFATTLVVVISDGEQTLVAHVGDGAVVLQDAASALVAFTDGLERLALDFAGQRAHAGFFNGIVSPVAASTARGRDSALCAALARYLDGPAVNARTDDDKTVVVAIHR